MESLSSTESSEFSGLGPSEKEPQRRFFDYSGPVESISLDGNTVNWYTNVVEAATKTEVFEKGIKRCMKGDRITYGGLKWRRGAPQIIEEESAETSLVSNGVAEARVETAATSATASIPVEFHMFKTGVSIECMTQDGIVLHRFVDIKSIRKQANFPIERIQTVLRKQQQKSAGFYWRFYDESRVNDSTHLISIEELLSYKETSGEYKQVLPSQKKLKIKYDDIKTDITSSGRNFFNGTDPSCPVKYFHERENERESSYDTKDEKDEKDEKNANDDLDAGGIIIGTDAENNGGNNGNNGGNTVGINGGNNNDDDKIKSESESLGDRAMETKTETETVTETGKQKECK